MLADCLPMFKNALILLFILICQSVSYATHQRAAEITYVHISGLTYEFTITTYTFASSPADRCELPIQYSDGNFDVLPRVNGPAGNTPAGIFCPHTGVMVGDNIRENIYKGQHTFAAPGNYTISVEDPNRNLGVVNIPNSVNVPLYVESEITINPFLGSNNSVQLLNPPIDRGCVGKLFVHNPAAYDPDGDSLSFKLVNCKGSNGLDIPGYTLPMASEQFYLDAVTGELIWENPMIQGEYNVAFKIEEWRNGVKMGSVIRDMQIEIAACDNDPPDIFSLRDTCVVARTTLMFDVTAIDPNGDRVTLTASGGPFEVLESPASIVPDPADGSDSVTTSFFWDTRCSHVRRSPFTALFKATDDHPVVNLTNYQSVDIRVIGPPVANLQAEALGNAVNLSWDPYVCGNAIGYKLYRRSGSYGFVPSYCETGVPAYTGFEKMAEISNIETRTFSDDNDGTGLSPGIDYCYLIIAVFPDGSESLAGNEACATLKRDLPVMTHVSNDSLNLQSGRVLTAWARPVDLDTIQFPGPYKYNLFRRQGLNGQNETLVFTGTGLNDTLFADAGVNLNVSEVPYNYYVQLESEAIGVIGNSRAASSLFLEIYETDMEMQLSWQPEVPWVNDSVHIYRRGPGETDFHFIGSTTSNLYRDRGLENEAEYCYYLQSFGGYSVPGIVHPIVNFSQIACGQPTDNVPPCPPILSVVTDCYLIENKLSWYNPYDSCSFDIEKYYVYYTPSANQAFTRIDSVFGKNDTTFLHHGIDYITGCYYIKAVDDYDNVSEASNVACVRFDACPVYELPNMFTPNNDQVNDLFVPLNYPSANPGATVERVDMTIFNRWGDVVFETHDPEINWDGKHQRTGRDVSDGVYFYVCEVYVATFEGIEKMRLQGSVTIMR